MTTDVVVRADDVTGDNVDRFAEWLTTHHPDVPCAAFAMETDRWDDAAWETAAGLVDEHGWEFGAHTRDHPMLPLLSTAELREAVTESVRDVEDGLAGAGLDYEVASFAYPCGDYDERTVRAVREAGLDCGLTYPDGFPYESCVTVPEGEDRYRWGVTHNAFFGLETWNRRFEYVHERDGCYVLCLHPEWWWDDDGDPEDVREHWGREEWRTLDDHLEHVREAGDVRFTTFRDCLARAEA
ncbi:MAG: polysaccharide deacetylase family protein [Halobacteriaceae archaeon]